MICYKLFSRSVMFVCISIKNEVYLYIYLARLSVNIFYMSCVYKHPQTCTRPGEDVITDIIMIGIRKNRSMIAMFVEFINFDNASEHCYVNVPAGFADDGCFGRYRPGR